MDRNNPLHMIVMMMVKNPRFVCKIATEDFEALDEKAKVTALKVAFEESMLYMGEVLPKMLEDKEKCTPAKMAMIQQVLPVLKAVQACVDKESNKLLYGETNFMCPYHNDKTPSMTYFPKKKGFKCFSCFDYNKLLDFYSILGEVLEIKSFGDQLKQAINMFLDSDTPSKVVEPPKREFLPLTSIDKDDEGIAYMESRGISLEIAKRLGVRVERPKDFKTGDWLGTVYIRFTNTDKSYTRRLVSEDKEVTKYLHYKVMKWWNSKGKQGVFNMAATTSNIFFVCESAMDALSCEEVGYPAVSVNSTSNAPNFFEQCKAMGWHPICLADIDVAGAIMYAHAKKAGFYTPPYHSGSMVQVMPEYPITTYKDVNDMLIADRDGLRTQLQALYNEAVEYYGGGANE